MIATGRPLTVPSRGCRFAASLNSVAVLKYPAQASAKPLVRSSSQRLALTMASSFRMQATSETFTNFLKQEHESIFLRSPS